MARFCSKRNKRNFGFGKQPWFAVRNALLERYGKGHYSTRATYESRWVEILGWLRDARGIHDLRQIDAAVATEFAQYLKDLVLEQEYEIPTAHSIMSAFNVVMEALSGRPDVWVSPTEHLGTRTHVRTTPPIYMDRATVVQVTANLRQRGEPAVAIGVEAAREGGFRFKEWCLADFRELCRGGERDGKITLHRGTKGSHKRVVPCTERLVAVLREAAALQGDEDNLIPCSMTYVQWRNRSYHAFYRGGGYHFHDLRASYACERYMILAGVPARVLRTDGDAVPSAEVDRLARQTVSEELGHHRREVSNAYLGGVRK